jgi:hypothetical protein
MSSLRASRSSTEIFGFESDGEADSMQRSTTSTVTSAA